MSASYVSRRFPWLLPPCDRRLSLRIPEALLIDLQRLASDAGASPATLARRLLADAVSEHLNAV
jgi:predicted DNA binding CopG/RHH family protein